MNNKPIADVKTRKQQLIDGASPELREKINEWLVILAEKGIKVLIYETYRSAARQDELYQLGRTKPGNIVTDARGGQSKHNATIDGKPASKAFDCCPMINNAPSWSKKGDALAAWEEMGKAAEQVGLYWGRNFTTTSSDWAHFEIK